MKTTRNACGAGMAVALALAMMSCRDGVAPSQEPSGTEWLEATTGGDVMGGDAALQALDALITRLRSDDGSSEVPVEAHQVLASARTLAEGPRANLVPTSSSNVLPLEDGVSGPYAIDGLTYYEKGGILYPPYGTMASIIRAYTTGVLAPGYAEVSAGFEFTGHKGTQSTTWKVTDPVTGIVLRSASHNPFGSQTGGLFSTVKVFAGHVKITDLPECDIALNAASTHRAWNVGGWSIGNITINSESVLGITIVPGNTGTAHMSTGLNPPKPILCREPEECDTDDEYDDDGTDGLDRSLGGVDDGALRSILPTAAPRFSCDDGDGGFGDEPDCTICQQWFTIYRGKIIAEWWECWDGSADECEILMS